MRERDLAGQGPSVSPGELTDDSAVPSPEVVALVGEDVVRYMDRAMGALEALDGMAATEDPFARDERGSQVDLGFLKPEQARLVYDYRITDRPFKNTPLNIVAKFGRKIIRNMSGVQGSVRQMLGDTKPRIAEVGDRMGQVLEEVHDKSGVSILPELQGCMDDLMTARDAMPSKATLTVVDNMYAAGISARNHVQSMAGQRRVIKIGAPKTVVDFTVMLREDQLKFKHVIKEAGFTRKFGTANFKLLSKLIAIEQIKEAVGVITTADTARQRLPNMEGLQGDELDAAIAAERYLADRATIATSVLNSTHPELLQDSKVIGAMVERLHPSYRERQLAAEQSQEIQTAIGDEVLSRLTEAKNILRGGRRLKPDNGQTERDVKRTADELHALKDGQENGLLDPEESGVIVAMVTGKFEGFAHVFGAVKKHAGDNGLDAFPADRLSIVQELNRFDLTAALTKIRSLFDEPHTRLLLERVISAEKIQQIKEIIKQTPGTDQADEI